MKKISMFGFAAILIFFLVSTGACSGGNDEGDNRLVAKYFVENDSTYKYDGLADTLKPTDAVRIGKGWQFTYEFDCRHAGYGDRNGQMLAEVITHHTAILKIDSGKVTSAIMDNTWNMIDQRPVEEIMISTTPIEKVTVFFMKSNPAQVGVHIVGGLPDGCTTFYGIEITREADTLNIKVTNQHPKDKFCPAIYTTFEKDVNLGSDFVTGKTYTVKVNDQTMTFTY
jgi:hypothetical protein